MAVRDLYSNSLIIQDATYPLVEIPVGQDRNFNNGVDMSLSTTAALFIQLNTKTPGATGASAKITIEFSEDNSNWYPEVADQELGNTIIDLNTDTELVDGVIAAAGIAPIKVLANVVNVANSSLSVTEQPDKPRTRYVRCNIENTGTEIVYLNVHSILTPLRQA